MSAEWLDKNEWYASLSEFRSRLRAFIVAFETNPEESEEYPVLTAVIWGHRVTMQAERLDSSDSKTSFNYDYIVEPIENDDDCIHAKDPLFVPD